METNNKPAWLETLWNVNPRLAEAAEKDVARWQKLETSHDKALHKHFVSNNEVAVCVHPFKFVVTHGSRCHCLKCGCDIDTQTDC